MQVSLNSYSGRMGILETHLWVPNGITFIYFKLGANYASRKTAQDYKWLSNTEVIDKDLKNFHVDDYLKSLQKWLKHFLLCDLQGHLMRRGFQVMTYIPFLRRANEAKTLDLKNHIFPIDRVLGVNWCIENDVFVFGSWF